MKARISNKEMMHIKKNIDTHGCVYIRLVYLSLAIKEKISKAFNVKVVKQEGGWYYISKNINN